MVDEVRDSVFDKIHEQPSHHWAGEQNGCRYDLFLLRYAEGKLPGLSIKQKDGHSFEPFILSIQCFPKPGINPLERIQKDIESTSRVIVEFMQKVDEVTAQPQLIGMRVGGDLLDFMVKCKQCGFLPTIMDEAAEKLTALMFSDLPQTSAVRERAFGKARMKWGQIKVYSQS